MVWLVCWTIDMTKSGRHTIKNTEITLCLHSVIKLGAVCLLLHHPVPRKYLVYEHRSRLEKSLQKERLEHKKAKEESLYNLREENRQLRKAHQDIHTQLQDVKQQHKNLLSQHNQLVVTLEDHKSALAAAQSQVEEYKQLKDTLNKMPSFRQAEKSEDPNEQPEVRTLPPHSDLPTRSEAEEHKEAHYDNMDHDIVQGEEEQGVQEEEGAYERDNQHQDEGEDDDQNNANEQQEPEHKVENQHAGDSVSMN
ncbi:golgi integral membrane protein 4 [Limosa lapponica baueri]|uniref:Golgi integral membrane protein 4 n=1 Tax=Limosa lapponica baueri TaxID=1758121 RepID=A0A2I0TA50_LIMLA|nr:golgi integral membrane protein 4 [Limosa lapponica baueri]